jgi:lipopolysaccharide/colanic/teichoic acid biosynthesis glycosyltransferase
MGNCGPVLQEKGSRFVLGGLHVQGSNAVQRSFRPPSPPPLIENQCAWSASTPVWKNCLDLLIVIFLLPVWLPLMCIVALGIKIVSRGPVFFRQERIGFRNKPFVCLKFRSMHLNAETKSHAAYMENLISQNVPMRKLDADGDPRLIRFGAFLRSTGLDELPQFINVLRREMSVVGPRPCTLAEYALYSDRQKERFNTLPGLTGLWQVNGKNRTTFKQMMTMDIEYCRNRTLWMDLGIILKTMPAILDQVHHTRDCQSVALPADRRSS